MKKASQYGNKQYPPQDSLMNWRLNCSSPSARQASPWANHLPSEILSRIASKCFASAGQYVSLRHVCREWRRCLTDYSPLPPLPSPQIPFLLLPRRACDLDSPVGYVCPLPFTDPCQIPMTYSLPQLDQTDGYVCVGSSHGWLITLSLDSSISLLNPVTGDSFQLPPLSSIDNTVLSFNPNSYPEYHFPQKGKSSNQASIIRRAVLSSDPVKDPGFTVLLFFSGLTDCCYTCTGDSITWRQHLHEPFLVEDVIFFNGVFVAVDLSINLAIFDFRNLHIGPVMKQQKAILRMSPKETFLVEAEGKLLLVVKWVGITLKTLKFPRDSIQIFEIVMLGQIRAVHSLPQCSLFIGHGCSVSVSVCPFEWLPEGMVYFPHVYAKQGNDEARVPSKKNEARAITLNYAGVYEFTVKWRTTRKAFAAENRRIPPLWDYLRFFWVIPNLNRQ